MLYHYCFNKCVNAVAMAYCLGHMTRCRKTKYKIYVHCHNTIAYMTLYASTQVLVVTWTLRFHHTKSCVTI